MWIRHRNKFISVIILGILSLLASLFHEQPAHQASQTPAAIEQSAEQVAQHFTLSPQRRIHILYGDGTGGGHRSGAGKPGKTEFPASWQDDKIIDVVMRIANDNHLPMRPSGKRYWIRMGEEDGLQIRVVLNRANGEIITGYPVAPRRDQ